jgi:catechol 2,3-dioxygenase-like lactoylglutathione lyase family enzyme
MSSQVNLVVCPVSDLAKSKALYGALLGAEPYVDQPYYVGYRVGDQEVGLDPNGAKQGLTGPLPYWTVADIRQTIAAIEAAGGSAAGEVNDYGDGKLVGRAFDADGNLIGLVQPAVG